MNNNNKISIFHYDNSRFFLREVLRQKKLKNPGYSIKAWSRKMKFIHASSLEYLLNGRRKIRLNHLRYIFQGLELTNTEQKYFTALVNSENSKVKEERDLYLDKMKKIADYSQSKSIEEETFAIISNWYYFVILAMTQLNDFKDDPDWISKRLDNKVSPVEISSAVNRLLRKGLLKRENGVLKATAISLFKLSQGWRSEGVKKITSQTLELAQKRVGKSEKDIFFTTSMTINTNKLKEANALLLEYKAQMAELMEAEKGDETYQLGIQFYKVTK